MYNTDLPTRAELPSTGKLIRSTLVAAVVAVALLVTVVLPAEYAIDPTGAGRLLGLTEMGEIKQQLAEEAELDRAATQAAADQAPPAGAEQQARHRRRARSPPIPPPRPLPSRRLSPQTARPSLPRKWCNPRPTRRWRTPPPFRSRHRRRTG